MIFGPDVRIITESQLAVAVLVAGDFSDLQLIPIGYGKYPSESDLDAWVERWAPRRLEYIGVIGISREGSIKSAFEVVLGAQQKLALLAAFDAYADVLIGGAAERSAVDWLEALYALPDNRD